MILQRRNFRFRHPIPEDQINDAFSEVYFILVQLIGVKNSKYSKDGALDLRRSAYNIPDYQSEQEEINILLSRINNKTINVLKAISISDIGGTRATS